MSAGSPERGAHPGRLIAVASGKGGVGKTWFAITLSHALVRSGCRVLLVDGDFGLANVDVQLGIMPRADLAAVVSGRMPAAAAVIRHEPCGFDLLPGASGSGALAAVSRPALERLVADLRVLAAGYDCVVLDLPAGLDRAVRQMAASADMLLVVVTEEPTSLTDAYAMLKLHAADGSHAEPRIVVNQAQNRSGAMRTYNALARACGAFLGTVPPLAGMIRRDEKVPEAIRHQASLLTRHPAAAAAADVEAIAAALNVARPELMTE